jgi:hypothetical protein
MRYGSGCQRCYFEGDVCTESGDDADLEYLTRPEDEEDSVCVVQRLKVTKSATEKRLLLEGDVMDYSLAVDHFVDTCLKFIHKMEAVMTVHKEVCKHIQKEATLLNTTSLQ